MPGKSVTFSGWKAVVVLAVVAGAVAFRVVTARSRLDTQGRAALERWVQGELIRPIVADTTKPLAERAAAIEEASAVRIRSLAVRGPLRDAVVRVELAPGPALPPGTDLVRYYHAQYSDITGWRHHGNATAVDWYLAALHF
jgi:hypothetical protein